MQPVHTPIFFKKNNRERILFSFQRDAIFTFLLFLFLLAYIAAPYWMLPHQHIIQLLLISVTLFFCFSWAYLACGSIDIAIKHKNIMYFLFFLCVMAIINFRPLAVDIPWRGDEDSHIIVVQQLLNHLPLLALSAILFITLIYSCIYRTKVAYLTVIIVLLFIIGYNYNNPILRSLIIRYPFFSRFFQFLAPLIAKPFGGFYAEPVYRFIPFISATIIVCICYARHPFSNKWMGFFFAFSVSLIPLLRYYSSVLYLEMPAVVLMFIVCLGIEKLLSDDFEDIKHQPCWYALILTGFIKETVFPFLASYIVSRLAVRFHIILKSETINKNKYDKFIDEIKIIFCVSLPLALYLCYRNMFLSARKYSPDISNLIETELYITIARAFLEQFGLFIVLFFVGCFLLFCKKRYRLVLFIIITFVSVSLFHILDNKAYIGYSRFNLFLIPPVFTGAMECLASLKNKKSIIFLILCAIFASNVLLSPVNSDGSKKPFWGNYFFDTSEHYYPYRETVKWLKKHHGAERILFTGMTYRYGLGFYFAKFNWHPEYTQRIISGDIQSIVDEDVYDMIILKSAVEEAQQLNCSVIVYHVSNRDNVYPKGNDGFYLHKVFRNRAHVIAVYTKRN